MHLIILTQINISIFGTVHIIIIIITVIAVVVMISIVVDVVAIKAYY